MAIESFVNEVIQNVKYQNGKELAKMFNLNGRHNQDQSLTKFSQEQVRTGQQYAIWRDMIICHLKVLTYLKNKDLPNALDHQFQLIESIFQLFNLITDSNWFLPVMIVIAVDLRCLAHAMDYGSGGPAKQQSNRGNNMVKAADCMSRLFRKCVSDKSANIESSKKLGIMALCNQLFKIYFTINQLNLCKSMILAIENVDLTDKFSISQQVTYNYYVGRKCMFDDNFPKANKCLTFAFENCHRNSMKNKRLILIYLIPVKMLLGSFATEALIKKYDLTQFLGIVKSVKMGNIRLMEEEMSRNSDFFISCGVYLILEKLKSIAYRNLFKTVAGMIGGHMMPIAALSDALMFAGVSDIDMDETGCILANLIFENKIKGYLAQQQQKLVMSKTNAFPPINQTSFTVTR